MSKESPTQKDTKQEETESVYDRAFQRRRSFRPDELPGIYVDNLCYFDLHDLHYLNNTGIANLIDLVKFLSEAGLEVRFVNVADALMEKLKTLGLDQIMQYA